jgi:radical SAM superfamily enzyme YgiQ (UPF0313 family)
MKNKNILLINPWIYDFAAYDFWTKPTGLLSIGNYLEIHGYHTSLIDCLDRFSPALPKAHNKRYGTGNFIRTKVEKPELLKTVPRFYCRYGLPVNVFLEALAHIPKPDVILITCMMTYWYLGVHFAIKLLKEKFPKVPVILGGIYATLCYDHAKKHSGADFIIPGAGEDKALGLVNKLTENDNNIRNFLFEFPTPSYIYYKKLFSIPIFTSYGCPFNCSFCASYLISGKFRQRDPLDVVSEIEQYYFTRHIRHFAFFDDALLINHEKHISVILDAISDKNLKLYFHTPNGIHPQEITSELAKKMYKTNFKTVRLSYETIDIARQKEMGQKVSNDIITKAITNLEDAGYLKKDIDVYVIMGLPGQPVDEVIESMLFVASLGAKIRLTSYSPIPGTKDWQRSVELYNMPNNIDPLLTNNSIYPLNRRDFTFETFQQLRKFSKVINYGLDNGVNYFDQSNFAKIVRRYLKSIK